MHWAKVWPLKLWRTRWNVSFWWQSCSTSSCDQIILWKCRVLAVIRSWEYRRHPLYGNTLQAFLFCHHAKSLCFQMYSLFFIYSLHFNILQTKLEGILIWCASLLLSIHDCIKKIWLSFQAGKGRTGLMVCAYLVYSGMSAEKALQLYAQRRTTNNEGVSSPSSYT